MNFFKLENGWVINLSHVAIIHPTRIYLAVDSDGGISIGKSEYLKLCKFLEVL